MLKHFIFFVLSLVLIPNAGANSLAIGTSTKATTQALNAGTTLSISGDLWQYIAKQATMKHKDASIAQYIDWFQKRPGYLTRISRRATWYLYYIVREIEKRNMPIELALLPVVESAFYPFAFSPEQASGLWQFIPSTGLSYGLTQNWWYDARRDVVASTAAALQYLQNLNVLFNGDWLLAIAAYNAGPGRVQKAIKKNEKLGKPTDFWHLKLPPETKSYVPKLLAVLEIIRNPDFYKQELVFINNQARVGKIDLKSQLDVRAISKLSGLSVQSIYELNPGLKRWATPPVAHYQLLLPIEVVTNFTKKLSNLPLSEQLEWVRYELAKDENLTDIAKAYNLETKQLEAINTLGGFNPRNSDFIIVPILKQHISFHALNEEEQQERLAGQRASKPIVYKVKPGDTLLGIALLHDVSLSDLALWNKIENIDKIKMNQALYISQQFKLNEEIAKAGINTRLNITRKILYPIKKNDTLSVLARRFRVSVEDIMHWNDLDNHIIKHGENLVLRINIVQ